MKKILFVLLICALPFSSYAQEIELLGDDILSDTESTASQETDKDDAGSIFGFITRPLSKLFSSKDTVTNSEGKEETYLQKITREADEGNLEAQMNLGYMYLYGANDVKQNFSEAFKYYEMAAKQNDPIALNNLGSLYFSGIGTNADIPSAITLFEKAAELGNDNASVNLAFIYLSGGKKDSQRNRKAFDFFQKAEKEGNKIARFMLGYAYYRGFMTEKDYRTAFNLIKSSAQQDSQIDEAQLVLAEMYRNGDGTVQNYQKAIKAYRAAIAQGNIDAIMTLADIYETGTISPLNLVTAHALYNIAAANGVLGAAEKREELSSKLDLPTLEQAQSIAQNYKASPSELTSYIRQTYGTNIRHYIDSNMK
ncbi:MAG: sel1 repeat family protein [Alphaproteobacteria bacterium]|nr:sel1 repeat family protein [Alphaproteobacteria bacterium]